MSSVYKEDSCNKRPWRNRQTRTFEGRVGNTVLVQVQSAAPEKDPVFIIGSFSLFLLEIHVAFNNIEYPAGDYVDIFMAA